MAKATEAAAARVSGIGRACYLLTGITTFSGIIDYAHISTHAHSHRQTDRHRQQSQRFRMEDTVTHNICNCLLLTCGSGRLSGLLSLSRSHTYAYLMRADLPSLFETYRLQIVGESCRLLAIISKSLKWA